MKDGRSSYLQLKQLVARVQYEFSDRGLLDKALSHRSVGKDNNERFEFLGDSLLNFFIAEALFQKFPKASEGDLSRLRSKLVCGETLAELARGFNLGDCLNLGEGEMKSGGFRRASILADAVEALIGAIYLDSDFATCSRVVLSWFDERLAGLSVDKVEKDPKTRLQEYLQERKRNLPHYEVVEMRGEAHAKEFVVECRLDFISDVCTASNTSKRGAEKLAAEAMLRKLVNLTKS